MSIPKTITLVARLDGDSSAFESRLPEMVRQVCASCALSKIARMETVLASAVNAPRSTAWLVGGFALLALGMAAAGIYGVVSHSVLRRTRELGARLALGASRRRIAWALMGSTIRHTLLGTLAGLFVAWALTRWIKTLLYGVPQHDLLSFSIAPLMLATVAILASLFPMYRAVRIHPAESPREG